MLKRFTLVALIITIFVHLAAADDKAVITFTFDDAPKSVYEMAFPILDHYKMPATIFLATNYLDENNPNFVSWWDVKDLDAHGWGIQCHTATHPYLTELSDEVILREFDVSLKDLRDRGFNPEILASPYGDFDERVLRIVKRRFRSHRAAWNVPGMKGITGLNDPDNLDLMRISAFQIQNNVSPAVVKDLIDQAVSTKQWLVFYMHGIVPGHPQPYQYNVEDFRNIVHYVHLLRKQGNLIVLRYADNLPQEK